jgi:hypothetical protein
MSSIKLTADSGGGTFELKAPSSSANTRVLTLPDSGNLTLGGGKILQVVQTFKTDAFSSTSTSYTDLTGLSVSITPTSTSNKILIACYLSFGSSGNGYNGLRLLRGSTSVGHSTALDSEAASNIQDTAFCAMDESSQGSYKLHTCSYSFLDSPSTTSATTYKIQCITYTGQTFRINRPNSIGNAAYTMAGTSSIIAMEVAA